MNITDWKALPLDVLALFRRYRIVSVEDVGEKKVEGYTQVNLRKSRDSEGKLLGQGPLIALDCLQRFVNACLVDGKVNCIWLNWLLFQIGGGQEAQRRANSAMEQIKERFLDERMRGFRDTKGQYHTPTSREEAAAKWQKSDGNFQQVLFVADQDIAEKMQIFGFFRHWPGPGDIYEKASRAVREFLNLQAGIVEMNEFMRRSEQKDKIIPTSVDAYSTVDGLNQAIKKVDRFFNSRAAREDIRVEKVYEDKIVRVLCPFTYAASVRYGWDGWPFSNRETMEQCLEGSGSTSWNDPWRNMTGKEQKALVFFEFLVPMPSWVCYEKNKFSRITLQNLACVIPRGAFGSAKLDPEAVEFIDEENRKVTLDAVTDVILAEPQRTISPEEEEYPILRGPRIFETEDQAAVVVDALEKAWAGVVSWQAKFNPRQIVADYMPKS